MKRLLSVRDVADLTGAAPQTLYQWCAQSKIPHVRLGTLIRFDADDVERWIETNRRPAVAGVK